jgi:hypothetical protein
MPQLSRIGNLLATTPSFLLDQPSLSPEITMYNVDLESTGREAFNPPTLIAAPDGNTFTVTIPPGSSVSMRYIA